MTPLDSARASALRALAPPPKIALADWIETHLRLPESVSALPGKVRLWPPQRGIAEAISEPTIERVTVVKPVRVGFTTLLSGTVASYVANEPSPILLLLPTEADCRDYVVSDLEPIFEATPIVKGLLADDSDRNTLLSRRFAGGSLKIVAAKAPRNLRRHNVRILIIDECDGFDVTVEGNAIALAERRTLSFPDRKIIMGSTPTIEETSNILRAYATSDQRVFEVPCPACGVFSEIKWAHIEWEEGKPETAAFRCPHCEELIDEKHKLAMVELGDWRITRPDVSGHAGFRLNALVSTLANASWGKLAAEFLTAKRAPDTLQAFTNTIFAEGWRESAEELDESDLQSRAEPFSLDAIPEEVRILTAGVDVQRDRLETTILGWSADEIFALAHHVTWGNPQLNETWAELDDFLKKTWAHPLGGRMKLDAVAVDSGDGETSDVVTKFCAPRFSRKIVAIKGAAGSRPAIERSHSKGAKLFIVGVDSVKAQLLTRLAKGRSVRFSNTLGAEYFNQLTSERRVIRYSHGRPVAIFERILGRRAEALDCFVYGVAVRGLVAVDFARRENELREIAAPSKVPTVIRSAWLDGGN